MIKDSGQGCKFYITFTLTTFTFNTLYILTYFYLSHIFNVGLLLVVFNHIIIIIMINTHRIEKDSVCTQARFLIKQMANVKGEFHKRQIVFLTAMNQ